MKCFGTTVTEVDLRGKIELNWLELVWLGITENTEEHLCGDEYGGVQVPNNQTTAQISQMEKRVDKLTCDPFNPKSKSATLTGGSNLPVDLQWSERASPNVNIDEASGDEVPELVATQKRWCVTELWSMSTVEQWAARMFSK